MIPPEPPGIPQVFPSSFLAARRALPDEHLEPMLLSMVWEASEFAREIARRRQASSEAVLAPPPWEIPAYEDGREVSQPETF